MLRSGLLLPQSFAAAATQEQLEQAQEALLLTDEQAPPHALTHAPLGPGPTPLHALLLPSRSGFGRVCTSAMNSRAALIATDAVRRAAGAAGVSVLRAAAIRAAAE